MCCLGNTYIPLENTENKISKNRHVIGTEVVLNVMGGGRINRSGDKG